MEKKEYLKQPYKSKEDGPVKCGEPSGGEIVPKTRRGLRNRRWIDYLIDKICGKSS
tara:strand:- start:83 stop:250 length:168 start_codon:yes stop_codon:yes gene_type:complete